MKNVLEIKLDEIQKFIDLFNEGHEEKDLLKLKKISEKVKYLDLPIEFIMSLDSEFVYLKNVAAYERTQKNKNNNQYVYAFEMNNNLVKIGMTRKGNERKNQVQSCNGSIIISEYFRKVTDCVKSENKIKKHFKDKRSHGEYYKITMQEAIDYIDSLN